MSNHVHILVCTKDANQCVKFYMEIQKKITEAIKRLLGLKYLNLWEGSPMVALIPDVDTVKDKIAYYYANPSKADLETDIESYPGLNSWAQFEKSFANINAKITESVPWIRELAMEQLPSASLSRHQDKFFSEKFLAASKKQHNLEIEPNAWMKYFNIINNSEVSEINNSIKADLRIREQAAEQKRNLSNKGVVGAHRLKTEEIMKAYNPKKNSRNIFVISLHKDIRIQCIKSHQEFCILRQERYEEWKVGDYSSPWPPGAFRPPMPPLANAVEFHQHSFM